MEFNAGHRVAPWMSEEHAQLADMVERFFAAELVPNMDRWRRQGYVDREFWNQCGELGLLGASMPEEYGGSGGDYGHDMVIFLEQARVGDAGWGFGVHNIVARYILNFGTDEQKQRWLPKLISGELVGAIAMTEPSAGSDLQSIRTTALADGDDYVINGSKIFITNGQVADLIVVVTKTDPNQGAKGISLMVLETEGAEGFSRGRNLEKIGLKAQDTSELFFENVRVPRENLLGGAEGMGFVNLMQELPYERLIIAMAALGATEMAVRETIQYVRERKAFGQPVMGFQNTRFKLAECKTRLEVMRAFVDSCVQKLLDGRLDNATGAMAKLWCTETQCEIIDECLQLHGGYGYMLEYPIAQLYADARVQRIYGGTSEIMKEIIGRALDAD
ncbi:MAG: acyl-CoA dehydrogenase family protein [Xanthomonadales bacterium]|nr:acyl-CoA dehydrogenase family protein [Xanthomonadales bacterium]